MPNQKKENETHLKWLLYAKYTHFIVSINYNFTEDWIIIIPILQIKREKSWKQLFTICLDRVKTDA